MRDSAISIFETINPSHLALTCTLTAVVVSVMTLLWTKSRTNLFIISSETNPKAVSITGFVLTIELGNFSLVLTGIAALCSETSRGELLISAILTVTAIVVAFCSLLKPNAGLIFTDILLILCTGLAGFINPATRAEWFSLAGTTLFLSCLASAAIIVATICIGWIAGNFKSENKVFHPSYDSRPVAWRRATNQ